MVYHLLLGMFIVINSVRKWHFFQYVTFTISLVYFKKLIPLQVFEKRDVILQNTGHQNGTWWTFWTRSAKVTVRCRISVRDRITKFMKVSGKSTQCEQIFLP